MPGDPVEPSLAAFPAIVDEVAPGLRLREATRLVPVRPDGHRTTDPDGIERYLAQVVGGALVA